MENLIVSFAVLALTLQIALLVALVAAARWLRRAIGVKSPSWIALYVCLGSFAEYTNPYLMKLLIAQSMTAPLWFISMGQLVSFLSSIKLILTLLAAFLLLGLVLADFTHLWQTTDGEPSSKWSLHLVSVARHEIGIGFTTVLLALAYPAVLAGAMLGRN